jgi:hypothetical protein
MKAYPYMHKHPTSGQTEIAAGMDLRDWFAGKAMQGMMVDVYIPDFNHIAKTAYAMADEMMKQRKEVPNE